GEWREKRLVLHDRQSEIGGRIEIPKENEKVVFFTFCLEVLNEWSRDGPLSSYPLLLLGGRCGRLPRRKVSGKRVKARHIPRVIHGKSANNCIADFFNALRVMVLPLHVIEGAGRKDLGSPILRHSLCHL